MEEGAKFQTALQTAQLRARIQELEAEKARTQPGTSSGHAAAATAASQPLTAASLAALLGEVLDQRGERSNRRDDTVPSVFAVQGVTAEQYAQVKNCLKSVKLTPPERWTDSEGSKGRDVKFFLQELKSFFEITCMPQPVWALFARNFLSAHPRKKWDREVEHLQRESGSAVIAWKDFDTFMQRSYASMLPAREARHRYNCLKQTGSVREYVREQIQLCRELEGTPYHPGGSVFDDFIRRLKPDVQTFVQDHAPSGWWIDIKDLYQKALDYE